MSHNTRIRNKLRRNQPLSLKDYYSRQEAMRELGREGQEKLRSASVVVIGLGGLGAVAAAYLTMAGVGRIRLVDQDTVEIHNLQRQILYGVEDVRTPKVEAAARRLRSLNPQIRFEALAENVRETNVDEIVSDCDCILDGLDNMATRYVVNRAAVRHSIPYIFAGAIGMEGNLSVFRPPATPCLECIMPGLDDAYMPTCETRGVLGTTTGTIGALEATEAIKLLTGIQPLLERKLLVCDFREMDFRAIDIQVRNDCRTCQVKQPTREPIEERLNWLCGKETANINPSRKLKIDLRSVPRRLGKGTRILLRNPMALVFHYSGHEITLFTHGRMLIKGITSEEEALAIFREIMDKVHRRRGQQL